MASRMNTNTVSFTKGQGGLVHAADSGLSAAKLLRGDLSALLLIECRAGKSGDTEASRERVEALYHKVSSYSLAGARSGAQ